MRDIEMTRVEILEAAKECVCGQREEDYGSPEDNFEIIAELWDVYFRNRRNPPDKFDTDITALDVAMMMALLKIARIMNSRGKNRDSFVDLAGYAACAGEVAEFEQLTDEEKEAGWREVKMRAKYDTGEYRSSVANALSTWANAMADKLPTEPPEISEEEKTRCQDEVNAKNAPKPIVEHSPGWIYGGDFDGR